MKYFFVSLTLLFIVIGCDVGTTIQSDTLPLEPSDFTLEHEDPLLFEASFSWTPGVYDTRFELVYRLKGSSTWDINSARTYESGRILNLIPENKYEVYLNAFNDEFIAISSDTIIVETNMFKGFTFIETNKVHMGSLEGEANESPTFQDSVGDFWVKNYKIKQAEYDSISTWNKLYDCPSCSANRIDWFEAIYFANEGNVTKGILLVLQNYKALK